ncbi:SGNH/GDSL hydrolase family protein [Methylobacterium sp. M6A4_1b]
MSNSLKRYIKLREHLPNTRGIQMPPEDYLAKTDQTLLPDAKSINIDEDGYIATGRGRDRRLPALMVLGDSTIENYWISERNRIAAVLENKFSDEYIELNALNAGVSGANLLHSLGVLLTKGLAEKLIGIIYCGGPIDTFYCSIENTYWTSYAAFSPIVTAEGRDSALPEQGKLDFEARNRLMATMKAIADIHDVPLWITTFHCRQAPYEFFSDKTDAWGAQLRMNKMINAATRRFCEKTGSNLIDLERIFFGRDELLYDNFHLNETGCPEVADTIFKAIRLSVRI